jgi:hypothetical protein
VAVGIPRRGAEEEGATAVDGNDGGVVVRVVVEVSGHGGDGARATSGVSRHSTARSSPSLTVPSSEEEDTLKRRPRITQRGFMSCGLGSGGAEVLSGFWDSEVRDGSR